MRNALQYARGFHGTVPTVSPAPSDESDALRALARALAPYLAEELRGYDLRGREVEDGLSPEYDDPTAARYVEDLGRDVVERAIELFSALAEPPHRIDSLALTERVGAVNPRDLAGILTTPLKRRADALGLPWPWLDGETRGRTVWRERAPGLSGRLLSALELASSLHRTGDSPLDGDAHTRPLPSAVFAYSSTSVAAIDSASTWSSVLRDSRPGSRAAIYEIDDPASIIALFDVAGYPQPDERWRWVAPGSFYILTDPIPRDEIVADDDLRPIFTDLTSRRRLPPTAQTALGRLVEQRLADGQLPPFAYRPRTESPTTREG
jgi:hypothetical protein